jgi:hypothetical protein
MSRTPTLWTTLRDFTAVIFVCIVSAVALYALVNKAHAEGLPPLPPAAYAEAPAPAWAACRPDVLHYCPNVLPGGGRILSCLAGNKDRLTLGCRDALLRAWAWSR